MKDSQTAVRQQAKRTSSSGSGHHLNSRGATRAQHHETAGFHCPRRHILGDPTKTGESTSSSTCQECCPPPSKFNSRAQNGRFRTGPHFGQELHKRARFTGPPASHFKTTSLDLVRGPTSSGQVRSSDAEQPATPRRQCGRRLGGAWACSAVTVERAHQCGIDGELHAPKQREAFGDNFLPSAIECLWGQQVQVSNHPRWWTPERLPHGILWPLHSPQQIHV